MATIKNLGITNVNVSGADNVGGLTGGILNSSTVSNCYSTGSVSGNRCVGGLVGINWSSAVYSCYSANSVSGADYIGGLIGLNHYHSTTSNCYSTSNVSGSNGVGGLVGVVYYNRTFVTNCYSKGSVLGTNNLGGLIGYKEDGATITSSYYDTQTSGQTDTGKGTPKTTTEMKTQSTYTDWDFETVWAIHPKLNEGYPYLRWQGLQPPPPVEVLPSYTPQSTIKLEFSAGDSAPYPMGIFYADKAVYKVGNAGTKIDGRNSIGKYLKDQSFDERCKYPSQAVSTMLEAMLAGAGLTKYYVQPSTVQIGMDFAPNKNILDGIEEILQYLPGWQMREEVDGTIVVGDRTDSHFTQPSRYTFQRDRDIFSREVVTDDRAIYGRVCVHTEDFTVRVYRPVTSDLGWTPPAQKTLYQQVPEGTTSMEAATIANSLAESMANSGKIETFVCAFRPQIIPGDEAEILEADASKNVLGVITQVKHSFGVQGFFTEIVVDSGGRVGKPRFKDIVSAFTPPPASKKN